MIRLEAKQAEVLAAAAAVAPENGASLAIVPVMILVMPERAIALSEKHDLAALLESDADLKNIASQKRPFFKAGYSLVFRSVSDYGDRSLYEYLAVKADSAHT
jgi:hypothetical protein